MRAKGGRSCSTGINSGARCPVALIEARQRRRLIDALLAEGFSQADLARELGVTRQAIQKMIAVGEDRSRRSVA